MFEEDLFVFFEAEEFATVAYIDGREVTGIFFKRYAAFQDVDTAAPAYKLPSDPVVLVEQGESQLVLGDRVSGLVYTIVAAEPSGAGTTLLKLRKG